MKSFSRKPREEVVRGVWAVMVSTAQVHSQLGAVETRNLARSSAHCCIRTMSMGEGSEAVLRGMSS